MDILNNLLKKLLPEYEKVHEVWLCWREQFGELYWRPFKQAIRSGPFWCIQLLNYFTVFRMYTIGTVAALSGQYVFMEVKQLLYNSYSAEISEQLFKTILNTFSALFQVWLLCVVMRSVFRFMVQRVDFAKAFSGSVRVFINYSLMYYYQVFSFYAYVNQTPNFQTLVYPLINLGLFSLNIWLIRRRISRKIYPARDFSINLEERWQPFIQLCSFGERMSSEKNPGLFQLGQSVSFIQKEYTACIKLRYSPIKIDLQWLVPARIPIVAKKWKGERMFNESSKNK